MTTAERAAAVRRFTQGSARLLLATDAASEGLNLHHRCRLVVHLDVPWTPLRLEQRVGRVDRLGQQRPVHSLTLVARATGEATIAAGLAARSERADQGAPFGTGDAPSQLLRAEAATEAVRVQQCRRLAGRRRPSRPCHSRPVLLTSTRHPDVVLAIRFTFVDASGALVWDTMAALGIPGVAYHQVLAESPLAIAAAAAEAHECLAVRLRSELRACCELLAERERAMLDRVTATEARLAAPLVQAGLFDRRSLRDVDAQRRVAGEVASRSRSRIAALERQARAISGGRWLVFAVTR